MPRLSIIRAGFIHCRTAMCSSLKRTDRSGRKTARVSRRGLPDCFQTFAGAHAPSPNRIILLRGVKADGSAEARHIFLEGLNSPFGMALVGNTLYVANTDALVKFEYHPGDTRITTPVVKVADLPAGPINHHWTKNVIANADGSRLYVTVGSNSNVAENGIDKEPTAPPFLKSIRRRAPRAFMLPACAIRTALAGTRQQAHCGPSSTSAMNWATTSFPTI